MTSKGSNGIDIILATLEVKHPNICTYGYMASFSSIVGFDVSKYFVILLVSKTCIGL